MMQKIKKFVLICSAWIGMLNAAPAIWDGSTDISWYEPGAQAYNLTTAEQLAGLAKLVNEGISNFEGKTITLGADIFLNDTAGIGEGIWASVPRTKWTPIGSSLHPFRGEFDGIAGKKNRKIYGLFINDASKNYAGLFGYTIGVKISNLDIIAGSVSAKDYVGALVGFAAKGAITNVHSEIKASGNNCVGGLVGYSTSSLSKSSAINNVAGQDSVGGLIGATTEVVSGTAKANSFFKGNVIGRKYVGGLVGIGAAVWNSYAEGMVKGDSNYVGGVGGYVIGRIDSTYHKGGEVSGYSYVGGLLGKTDSSVANSYSEGNVTGIGDYVGGIVGHSYYSYEGSSYTVIMASQNSYAVGNVKGANYVGGLIGLESLYSSKSCNFYRNIFKSHSESNVDGVMYVGGLVGQSTYYGNGCKSYDDSNRSFIDSSYHIKGDISATSSYVGGIAGYTYGKISNTYNEGRVEGFRYVGGVVGQGYSVTKSYANGIVRGQDCYIGGVAGKATGYINYTYHTAGIVSGECYIGGIVGTGSNSVKNSYSEGNVIGSSTLVGGIAGYVDGLVDSTYHKNGYVIGSSYVGGIVGYSSSVKNSYSIGDVTGEKNYIGGLVGSTYSVSKSFVVGNVKSDSNYVGGIVGLARGTIDSSYHKGGNVVGRSYVGGLAGADSSSITNSFSEGDVIGSGNYIGGIVGGGVFSISKGYAKGSVNGVDYVGGLAGCAGFKAFVGIDSSYHTEGHVSGNSYVGGLVGIDSIFVQNSFSEGNVVGSSNYVGGLVGFTNSSVKNSYAEGEIKSDLNYVGGIAGYSNSTINSTHHANGDVIGVSYVGGLAGYIAGTVNTSHFEGNVTGNGNYVGGIAGHGNAISKGFAKGNVIGFSNYVGGLAGKATGMISSSFTEVLVSGVDSVGGLVGAGQKIKDSYASSPYVKGRNSVGGTVGYTTDSIKNSYFEGDSIVGIYQIGGLAGCAKSAVDSSYSTAHVKGDDNVGGLIGSAYGNVSNSYAIGDVVGDVEHSSAGNDNIGGLVGYQYGGSVSKSMALGNVSGTTKLGGLVGRFDGTKISQSYANGNVTGDYYGDPADEVGNYYIGGLVGYAKGTLEETYASGNVKGIEDEPVYTGCMVGYVNGSLSVTKSYYDKSKCSLGIDGGEETVTLTGTPDKTTAEMQTQSTFEEWDFTDTWKIMENTYPFLQIYSNSLTNAVVTTQSLEGINYDGTAKTPLVTSVALFGETLEYETEYTITYKDNINAGTASINVCGVKPYGGCKVVEFEIASVAIKPTIAAIDNMTYMGRALTPEIEVYNGETLLAVKDYTAEYKDNVNAGTATVTVTMKGNYSGSASKTFTIEKAAPVINQNPTASNVVLGQTLAASELSGGCANVDGEFVWRIPTTKPALENDGFAVVFVPADTNYTNSAEIIVPVKVLDLVYVAVHAGDITIDSTTLVKGASYTLPSAPDSTGYDFVGFYNGKTLVGKLNDKIVVSENTVIDAKYNVKTFVITFMSGTTKLLSIDVAYGTVPTAPTVTLPKNTAQYTYSFAGWDKDIVAVTEAATYTAVIDSVVNKYEIVFKDYDGTELKDSSYEYGTTAEKIAKPANPKREASARYTYTFKGWDPTVSDVIEDKIYTATFDSSINTYLIAFVNKYDTLQSIKTEMEYGAIPAYEGTPTRKSTAQYVYTFKEWTPEVEAVSEVATYTAVFDSVVQSYTITFVNGSEELQSDEIAYGALPEYAGVTPTKTATAQYTYAFKGWTPAIAKVTGTATYKAVFDSVVTKYLITFKNGSTVIRSDSLAYGTFPTVPSITLPKNTAQYTYSMNWDKTVVKVTGDAVYIGTIDSAVNKFEISFKNYDGTLIKDSTYAYGSTVAKPANPTRTATAKYTFTFKGWTPAVASVTANAVYKAVFDSTVRTYTVSFMNGDKKLQTSNLAYGSMPKYTGVTPTKASTKNYSYEFIGWSPKIGNVVGEATYKAVFDSVKTTGMMDNRFANMEMSVNVISRNIQISAAPVGSIYAILDMQGRVLKKGRVESANFNIAIPQAGNYLIRIGNQAQRISVK